MSTWSSSVLVAEALRARSERHFEVALQKLEEAAGAGDGQACWELGRARSTGLLLMVKDNTVAAEWYRKSALSGYPPGMAHYSFYLKHGRGGEERDMAESQTWAAKALSSGEAYAIAYCHHCGLGTRKDVDLAHAIYIDAAERGNAYACYVLGALFEKDSSEAKKWLERGALAGLGGAQHKLGQMYERGRGVQRDLARAFFWYTVATDQGCTESKLTLSRIYFSQLNAPIKGAELLCSIAHGAPRGQDDSPPKCVSKMRLRISLASLRSDIDAVDLEELWLYGRVLHAQPRLACIVAGRDDWIPSSLESLYLQSVGHARRAAVTLLSLHSKRKNPLFLLIGKDVVAVLAQMILSSSRKPSNWHVTWSPLKKVDMTTEEIMLQSL